MYNTGNQQQAMTTFKNQLATKIANVIQNKMHISPLHRSLAQNMNNNANFTTLVNFAADLAIYYSQTMPNSNPQLIQDQAVEKAVMYTTALEGQKNPTLMAQVDSNMYNTVSNILQEYYALMQNINNQSRPQYQYNNNMQQYQQNNNSMFSNIPFTNQSSNFNTGYQNQQNNSFSGFGNFNPNVTANSNNVFNTPTPNYNQPNNQQYQQINPSASVFGNTPTKVSPDPEPVKEKEKIPMWKRTKTTPYLFAYVKSLFKEKLIKNDQGVVEQSFTQRLERDSMNYNDHDPNTDVTKVNYSSPFKIIPVEQTSEEINDITRNVIKKRTTKKPPVIPNYLCLGQDRYCGHNSLTDAWNTLQLQLLKTKAKENQESVDTVFIGQSKVMVWEPLFMADREAIVDLYNKCFSSSKFMTIHKYLLQHKDQIPTDILRFFDTKFTNVINNIISNNLGIDDTKIDSFIYDYAALCKAMSDAFGPEIIKLIEDNESDIIANMTDNVAKEDLPTIMASFETEEETNPLTTVEPYIMINKYVLTYVNVNYEELNYAFNKNIGNIVSLELCPTLYAIIQTILKQFPGQHNQARCLVMTKDGIVMELVTGWLSNTEIPNLVTMYRP